MVTSVKSWLGIPRLPLQLIFSAHHGAQPSLQLYSETPPHQVLPSLGTHSDKARHALSATLFYSEYMGPLKKMR